MTIELLQTNSENNRMAKVADAIATLEGTLREETSIIDPVIMVETSASDAVDCNYIYIEAFKRYYFVNNIVSIRNGLWELHCHVDVLMSFKSEILGNVGIVKRQMEKWNLYLDDGTFKIYQNPIITTTPFPNGFSAHEYVLAVVG